jgi:uncharacterized phiE125 gp8 family phage protein
MGLKLLTPAVTTPVTLAEAKAHLRVIDNDDDAAIAAYIEAATKATEAFLGRALIDQTWQLVLDSFPTGTNLEIKIPKPPLIEIVDIAYDDPGGAPVSIVADQYFVDNVSEPGWVVPANASLSWPAPISAINSVRIRFRAGYVDNNSPPGAAVPGDIKSAILLTIGNFYEQREGQVVGTVVYQLPWGIEQLLRQHRVLLGMA